VKSCSGADCLIASFIAGKVVLQSTRTTQTLAVDVDEWVKFVDEVKVGEWDNVLTDE
jgi:hypothetical protein